MSVNPDLAGRRYELPEPYLVGREHVRSFAKAVLATSPAHLELAAARAAGYPDLVAPHTFPAVLQDAGMQLFLADSGIELSHIVHGEESFEYVRPIVAGDELSATLEIASVKMLGSNAMITAETAVRDAAGELVVTGGATLVVRGDAA